MIALPCERTVSVVLRVVRRRVSSIISVGVALILVHSTKSWRVLSSTEVQNWREERRNVSVTGHVKVTTETQKHSFA